MKTVAVEEAVGLVLCHDMTEIIPGESKGPAFKKGHIVQEGDISRLLDMGKRNIFVFDLESGLVHEDDAACRIGRAVSGPGIELVGPREGKIELVAACDGLLKVDVALLDRLNDLEDVMLATLHTNQPVTRGKVLGGTRVIPLVVPEEIVAAAEALCGGGPLLQVMPYRQVGVGIVTTGSEVFTGRVKDRFGPVVRQKVEAFNSSVTGQVFVADAAAEVAAEIISFVTAGAGMVAVTGGMSVDPDDVSPLGIRMSGAEVVSYGVPALPGAMFMLAYLGDVPVVGLPGCVMYNKISIFDLLLPRLLAGERLELRDLKNLAHGGLCLNCEACHYPDCGFGKGRC